MIAFGARSTVVVLLCLFVGPAEGQNDPAKEKAKATNQMREVAQAIKQCPQAVDRMSPPNSQCFSTEAKAGPPLNVTWDVAEKRTARAPYQGYVEFELPATMSSHPDLKYGIFASSLTWAQTILNS